jgi:hypothetical protein
MLFARDNNVKLYRVFNSLAVQYPQMKFAVVAQTGAKALETKYCNRTTISPHYSKPKTCFQIPHNHRQQGDDYCEGPLLQASQDVFSAHLRKNAACILPAFLPHHPFLLRVPPLLLPTRSSCTSIHKSPPGAGAQQVSRRRRSHAVQHCAHVRPSWWPAVCPLGRPQSL